MIFTHSDNDLPAPDAECDTVSAHVHSCVSKALLSTVCVFVKTEQNKFVKSRALLDSGSTHSLITDSAVKKLKLQPRLSSVKITGVGGAVTKSLNMVKMSIASRLNNSFRVNLSALVVERITSEIPAYDFDLTQLKIPKDVILADPKFNISAPVDVLLGADIFLELPSLQKD